METLVRLRITLTSRRGAHAIGFTKGSRAVEHDNRFPAGAVRQTVSPSPPHLESCQVVTRTSAYVFHLSAHPRTVDQQLGGGTMRTRLLTTIIECTIGAQRAWTVNPDVKADILLLAKPELQFPNITLRIEPVT